MVKVSSLGSRDDCLKALRAQVFYDEPATCATSSIGQGCWRRTADGIKRTGESLDAEGKASSVTYTAKYDGKDYPVSATDLYDTISIKRINDHTVELVPAPLSFWLLLPKNPPPMAGF
jgi:hypothetical protein